MSKTVLITGANRGIGLAFAQFYTKKGYKVIATVRHLENAKPLIELGAQVLALDCQDNQALKTFANTLPMEPIDLLINNAGIIDRSPITQVTPETLHLLFQVNSVAPLMIIQTLLSRLRLSKEPKVINITSRVGSIEDNGSGGYVAYRTSKTALNMINKTLSIEIPDVAFLALHPGFIQTDMVQHQGDMSPEEAVSRMAKVIHDFHLNQTGQFLHRDGISLPW